PTADPSLGLRRCSRRPLRQAAFATTFDEPVPRAKPLNGSIADRAGPLHSAKLLAELLGQPYFSRAVELARCAERLRHSYDAGDEPVLFAAASRASAAASMALKRESSRMGSRSGST